MNDKWREYQIYRRMVQAAVAYEKESLKPGETLKKAMPRILGNGETLRYQGPYHLDGAFSGVRFYRKASRAMPERKTPMAKVLETVFLKAKGAIQAMSQNAWVDPDVVSSPEPIARLVNAPSKYGQSVQNIRVTTAWYREIFKRGLANSEHRLTLKADRQEDLDRCEVYAVAYLEKGRGQEYRVQKGFLAYDRENAIRLIGVSPQSAVRRVNNEIVRLVSGRLTGTLNKEGKAL